MTKEEIIQMAKQSGIDIGMWEKLSDNDDVFGYDFCGIHENLEAFATLVAAKEREACALLCYEQRKNWDALACADAIRAGTRPRGQA